VAAGIWGVHEEKNCGAKFRGGENHEKKKEYRVESGAATHLKQGGAEPSIAGIAGRPKEKKSGKKRREWWANRIVTWVCPQDHPAKRKNKRGGMVGDQPTIHVTGTERARPE